MIDIWRGTYAGIPASVQMVGLTPRAFLGERMVFQEDEIGIFRLALASKQVPDPRPSDMAELARLVAIELRKRGIWAQSMEFVVWVPRFNSKTASPRPFPWTMALSEFDNLGPVACTEEIVRQESARAQEWAGDK